MYFTDCSLMLSEVTYQSVFIRLLLAVILSGIIGLERGKNKHTAGFRTHILVCVGSCLAMLTNQYIFQYITDITDPARLGAQVITGVGFLGVGTIIVTSTHKIKGLTTAAGLWASACLGLAVGIGFYFGAIVAGILIFISLSLLPSIENYFYKHSKVINLYVEFDLVTNLKTYKKQLKSMNVESYEFNISQQKTIFPDTVAFYLELSLPKGTEKKALLDTLNAPEYVRILEEL